MSTSLMWLLAFPLLSASVAYLVMPRLTLARTAAGEKPRARLSHYGMYGMIWCALPSAMLLIIWLTAEVYAVEAFLEDALVLLLPDTEAASRTLITSHILQVGAEAAVHSLPVADAIANKLASFYFASRSALWVLLLAVSGFGFFYAQKRARPNFAPRGEIETVGYYGLLACALTAVLITAGIVFSLAFETARFFQIVPFTEFFFGLEWSPQVALREGQVGASGRFGAVPLFVGTFIITLIAIAIAGPVGLFSAVYLSEYADPRTRTALKPMIEILAGIPTVVYGFFAAITVSPLIRSVGEDIGIDASSESALAAGLVMGIMIIPFVSSLCDDVIAAVPDNLRDGSYAMGATQSETIRAVVIPAALPGIMSAFLLGISRAIGETMIVVMAAGLAANLTANPFEAATTVTVQIVTLLVGDQEFDSPKTLAAFALGATLFMVTLCLNLVAMAIVRRYRNLYE